MNKYRLSAVVKQPDSSSPHPQHITSLSYHPSGEFLVAVSHAAHRLYLLDALNARLIKTVSSVDNRCRLAAFTHHPLCVLFTATASDGEQSKVLLLSFHDNTILSEWSVHGTISSVSMSPKNDHFIVAGSSGFYLFNVAVPENAVGHGATLNSVAAFDPQGLVFCVASDGRFLRLYDAEGFAKGPFASFDFVDPYTTDHAPSPWSQCAFSPDGKLIMLRRESGHTVIVDSFDGECRGVIKPVSDGGHVFTAVWTPDSKTIISGVEDGRVVAWNVESGEIVASMEGHLLYPQAIAFNPQCKSFASACSNIAFWREIE